MVALELKVVRIGNSRGVRLPAPTLERYGIVTTVIMEERSDGILLRPPGRAVAKLTWEETAREMAASREDWSEWDAALGDGLADLEWEPSLRRVAQPRSRHRARRSQKKRR